MGARKAHKKPKLALAATWPMYSDNMGVATSQVKEAMEESRRIGVPTDFCPTTGRAIFTSALHRKKYAEKKDYFVVTPQGPGYSDPVRLSNRERDNRGYTDTNRLRIPPGQAKYSANWTRIDWSKKA